MSGPSEDENRKTGYTYWKRDIADSHLLPSCEPRKIEHSSSEESINSRTASVGGTLVSRWNSGTTYEEKNITERAKRLLNELIPRIKLNGKPLKLKSISGEVHAHIVRGKPKIGYEITSMDLQVDGGDVISVEDIDSTDPEGFTVNCNEQRKIRDLITKLMKDMTEKLLSE
jgi:hypothetical protein